MRNRRSPRPVSLCDVLDQLLDTGVVVLGESKISVAEFDLIYVGLKLVVTSMANGRDRGLDLLPDFRLGSAPEAAALGEDRPRDRSAVGAVCGPSTSARAPVRRSSRALEPNSKHDAAKGLGQLVLTVVKLLHDLLERQALRRIETESFAAAEIERLGIGLMEQAKAIERLCDQLGLELTDLDLDLGPLGNLL